MKKKTLERTRLSDLLREGTRMLAAAGIREATLDAWLLLEYVTGMTRAQYYMEPDKAVEPDVEEAYCAVLRRRQEHVPLQHITGVQEFMGFPFHVNGNVLIPRQDTEILVESALEKLEAGMQILDLCTGSGCIAASLYLMGKEQKKLYGNTAFTAADISADALCVAENNFRNLQTDIRVIQSDLFEKIPWKFDMIVSNPPYIRTEVIEKLDEEVRLHDPYIALDGKEDGLYFYRKIAREAPEHLKKGGWLLLEIGSEQRLEVSELLRSAGFEKVEGKKDLAGLDRVVMGMYNK